MLASQYQHVGLSVKSISVQHKKYMSLYMQPTKLEGGWGDSHVGGGGDSPLSPM